MLLYWNEPQVQCTGSSFSGVEGYNVEEFQNALLLHSLLRWIWCFLSRGEPNTPVEGEVYAEDGHSKLSEQVPS
jgi:hypothetical protein